MGCAQPRWALSTPARCGSSSFWKRSSGGLPSQGSRVNDRRSTKRIYRRDQRLDVACGMGAPTVAPSGVVDQLWHMIVDDEASEADLFECPHSRHHVHIAFTQEALLEDRHMALH